MKINSFLRDQGLFAFLLVLWLEKIAQFTPATLELHPLSRIKSVIWQNIICITMIDVKSYAHFSSMSMEQNMEFQLRLLYDKKNIIWWMKFCNVSLFVGFRQLTHHDGWGRVFETWYGWGWVFQGGTLRTLSSVTQSNKKVTKFYPIVCTTADKDG